MSKHRSKHNQTTHDGDGDSSYPSLTSPRTLIGLGVALVRAPLLCDERILCTTDASSGTDDSNGFVSHLVHPCLSQRTA